MSISVTSGAVRGENRIELADLDRNGLDVAAVFPLLIHGDMLAADAETGEALERDCAAHISIVVTVDDEKLGIIGLAVACRILKNLMSGGAVGAQNSGLGSIAITFQPSARKLALMER